MMANVHNKDVPGFVYGFAVLEQRRVCSELRGVKRKGRKERMI